jgi:hypothetical protein
VLSLMLPLLAWLAIAAMAVRYIVLWYFKINRITAALEDIAVSLRTLPTVQAYDRRFDRKPPRAA